MESCCQDLPIALSSLALVAQLLVRLADYALDEGVVLVRLLQFCKAAL
jgi:hypothetical protein